jgi:hypothetical protein
MPRFRPDSIEEEKDMERQFKEWGARLNGALSFGNTLANNRQTRFSPASAFRRAETVFD